MKWARWRTLTESTCRTPVRASVRSNVAIVGVAWGRSVKPWAARAIRRAWSCVSWSTRELNQTGTTPPARSGQVEELLAHGVHDGLHAGVELQLLQDVADVVLDRVLGDEQLLGDLTVVEPLGDEAQHLELAIGEPQGRALLALGLRHLLELVDELDGHGGADQGLALVDHADRLGDLLDGGVLEQVAGGTVLDRLVEVGLLVGDGEHDDLGGRHGLLDRATGLDAGAARHPYVEQDHVGRGGDRQLGGGDAVGGLADHLDVDVSTQQHDEATTEELLVVDDQDADGFGPS